MITRKLTDNEKEEVVEKCKSMLREAGFDNVAILANEGGSNGTVRTSCFTRPGLFQLLLATIFMNNSISKFLKEDSSGKKVWDALCCSLLEAIVPQIRRMESEMKEEGKNEA